MLIHKMKMVRINVFVIDSYDYLHVVSSLCKCPFKFSFTIGKFSAFRFAGLNINYEC